MHFLFKSFKSTFVCFFFGVSVNVLYFWCENWNSKKLHDFFFVAYQELIDISFYTSIFFHERFMTSYLFDFSRKVFSVLMKRCKFCWQLPFPEEEEKLVFTLKPSCCYSCGFALKKLLLLFRKKKRILASNEVLCCSWKPSGTMNIE